MPWIRATFRGTLSQGHRFYSRRRIRPRESAEREMNIVLKSRSAAIAQNAPQFEDTSRRYSVMKNVLLSACAAVVIATGASAAASAADFTVRHDSQAGTIIRIDDVRPGYGWHDDGYYSGGYRQHGVVPPNWIVRSLQRQDYRYISQPVLSGRFYQVKAVSPHGRKVKLYIDAYSGRIMRVKA